MTYQEALQYLDSFINYEKVDEYNYKASLKLERMKRLAALLGDPQRGTRSIHIAGSKGKGSTASYAYSILRCAGYRVGLYTSPHLISFRERIRINDELISEEDLARILTKIREVIDSLMRDERPTFFEVYTALSFLYFKEKRIDFAVYEVGLGGRLDATNLVEPLVCAITSLSYEHTEKLGFTLEEIAAEKCGIIKNDVICISAPQEKEALKTIEDICMERRSKLFLVGKNILFKEVESNENLNIFSVSGMFQEYPHLKTALIGPHQIVNAATAIGIIEALRFRDIIIPTEAIRKGIEDAKWDGRLEVINKKPFIVLDGAQNRASAHALAEAIKKIFIYKRLILVLGVSKDKDINGILEELMPISGSIVLTKSKVAERAMEPVKIKESAENISAGSKNIVLTSNIDEALKKAKSIAETDDLILITGSLFVVGEAKSYLAKENPSECIKTR